MPLWAAASDGATIPPAIGATGSRARFCLGFPNCLPYPHCNASRERPAADAAPREKRPRAGRGFSIMETMLAAMERRREPTAAAVVVNGSPRPAARGATIQSLIGELGLDAEAVAVERNREIVKRGNWNRTVLEDGDTIEIVHFVGGG